MEAPGRLKKTLHIGGVAGDVTVSELRRLCEPFGHLLNVTLPKDPTKGELFLIYYILVIGTHRGFGFVEFDDEEDARDCIDNLHEAELHGRILTVTLARQLHRDEIKSVLETEEEQMAAVPRGVKPIAPLTDLERAEVEGLMVTEDAKAQLR